MILLQCKCIFCGGHCKYQGAFTISSVSNPEYCIEIQDEKRQNAAPIILGKCSGKDGQLWKYDKITQVILSVLDPTFVIDIKGNPLTASDLIIWPRHNGDTQRWLISTDGVIQNIASRKVMQSVLDRGKGVILNSLLDYNSPDLIRQQWQIFPFPDPSKRDGAFYLVSKVDPTMVLTIAEGSAENGVQIVARERNVWAPESDQQLFSYDSSVKTISSQLNPKKVFDIAGNPQGSILQVWDQTGGGNQRFDILEDGRIKCAYSDRVITFVERHAPVKMSPINRADIRQIFKKVYYQDPTQDAFFIQWSDDPRAVLHVESRQDGARITCAFKMPFYQMNQLFRYEGETRHIVSVLEPKKCISIFGGVKGNDLVLWKNRPEPNLQWELLPWGGIKSVYANAYMTFRGIGNQVRVETGHPEKPQRWITVPLNSNSQAPLIGLSHLQDMISKRVQATIASGEYTGNRISGNPAKIGTAIGAPGGPFGEPGGRAGECAAAHPYNPKAGMTPNQFLPVGSSTIDMGITSPTSQKSNRHRLDSYSTGFCVS